MNIWMRLLESFILRSILCLSWDCCFSVWFLRFYLFGFWLLIRVLNNPFESGLCIIDLKSETIC